MAEQPDDRWADRVVVPDVVGMLIGDAREVAHAAGLTLAQHDPDGPPLLALVWPHDYEIISQQPAPGTRLWRWDSVVVRWASGAVGDREPASTR